jgi:6-pyruvoyltetrahydropterin/6-carboxytetrahydropterin synthase
VFTNNLNSFQNLDLDVPELRGKITTTENVAVFVWQNLSQVMPDPSILFRVVIHETQKNAVIYEGE